MDGASSQAGSVFAGKKVHFAANIRRHGKKQLCTSAPVGRKSVLIHQPGGSLVLRPQRPQRSSPGGFPPWIPLSREM